MFCYNVMAYNSAIVHLNHITADSPVVKYLFLSNSIAAYFS
jgi:hypothetical protein